jgi:type VI secretion system protein ImpK
MLMPLKDGKKFSMVNNSPLPVKKRILPEIASDIFILIIQLRSSNEYGDPGNLKNKIREMLDKFESRAKNASIDYEKIRQAKFALAAFIR